MTWLFVALVVLLPATSTALGQLVTGLVNKHYSMPIVIPDLDPHSMPIVTPDLELYAMRIISPVSTLPDASRQGVPASGDRPIAMPGRARALLEQRLRGRGRGSAIPVARGPGSMPESD